MAEERREESENQCIATFIHTACVDGEINETSCNELHAEQAQVIIYPIGNDQSNDMNVITDNTEISNKIDEALECREYYDGCSGLSFSWPYHPEYRSLIGFGPPPLTLSEFFMNPYQYDPRSEILHQENEEGDIALYLAAKNGFDQAVNCLISVPETMINWHNHKGITALSAASHKGHTSIVEALIKAGANVNAESKNGSTPLIQASHFGHIDVVRLLVEAGANVDRPNVKGTTALMRATQEGKEEVVKLLIKYGADVSRRNKERMNALMLGSQRGHASIVRLLISNNAEVDSQTAQGSTALMLACKRGHTEVVKVLLTAGADIHVKDMRGRTARDTASRRWYHNILDILSDKEQMKLMQEVARIERNKMFHWIYSQHHSFGKYEEVNDIPNWIQTIHQCFEFPHGIFNKIVEFIPIPRLWEGTITRLRRRCHSEPNDAVRGGLQLIDEIFTDLIMDSSVQRGHMIRIARSDHLKETLLGPKFNMPPVLLSSCCEWSDIQSVCIRIGSGVNYDVTIAIHIVYLANEILKWSRCWENRCKYTIDNTSILMSHMSSNEVAGSIGSEMIGEGGIFESDSSASEIES